jgi:hypothetical protein
MILKETLTKNHHYIFFGRFPSPLMEKGKGEGSIEIMPVKWWPIKAGFCYNKKKL